MKIVKIVFLLLFITSSAVHLWASAKSDTKLRAKTKGFILSSLLLWYITAVPQPRFFVIAALLFSWLGDVLLIGKGIKWFAAGGISFGLSHVFFCLSYLDQIQFSNIPVAVLVIASAVYITAGLIIFSKLKIFLQKSLLGAMFSYMIVNSTQGCFALLRLLTIRNTAGLITFIGTTLFFISDATLFFVRFAKDGKKRNHFMVMLTYIAAEFLIILGLVL